MAIRESVLNTINSIATSDFVRAVTSAGASSKVTVSNLAKTIIENYSGSSLGGSTRSVKSAIDALNTKSSYAYHDVKSLITAASGVNITSAYLYVWGGRVAQLFVQATFSSAQTANNSYDIGTLASAIRPHNMASLGSTYGAGQITSSGVLSFRPQVNLNAGSSRYFAAAYMLLTSYDG